EERQDVDLGVPEVVPAVPGAREALGRHAVALRARRRLGELEEVPAHGLLDAGLAGHLDVGARPEVVEPLAMQVELRLDARLARPVERAAAAVHELARRHAARRVVRDELGEPDRPPGLRLHAEHVLGEVLVDLRAHVPLVLGLEQVVGRDGKRHAGVRAPVGQHQALVVAPLRLRLQHAPGELVALARVEPLAERRGPHVVLVLAVLAVEDLRRDRDRRRVVEHRDLERHDREVALDERHHALRADLHALARRRAPHELAPQDAVAQVERALVVDEVRDGQQERLVVDVEPDHLRVRDVDDGLAHAREPVRLLGVPDRPGLVEPVDERPVRVGLAALLDVAAHAEVAVRDGEQRLGHAEVLGGELRLDEPPRLGREAQAVDGALLVGGAADHASPPSVGAAAAASVATRGRSRTVASRSPRSVTTTSAPCACSAAAPTPRSTPSTRPKPPAAPAWTPESASSTTTASAAGTPRSSAARRYVSGAGLPAMCSRAATFPSTTTANRSASPAAARTAGVLREDETTATAAPARATSSRKRTEPG